MSLEAAWLLVLGVVIGAVIGMVLTYAYGPRVLVNVTEVRETASLIGTAPYRHRHQPAPQPYLEDPGSGLNVHRCQVDGCRASIRVKRPKEPA